MLHVYKFKQVLYNIMLIISKLSILIIPGVVYWPEYWLDAVIFSPGIDQSIFTGQIRLNLLKKAV